MQCWCLWQVGQLMPMRSSHVLSHGLGPLDNDSSQSVSQHALMKFPHFNRTESKLKVMKNDQIIGDDRIVHNIRRHDQPDCVFPSDSFRLLPPSVRDNLSEKIFFSFFEFSFILLMWHFYSYFFLIHSWRMYHDRMAIRSGVDHHPTHLRHHRPHQRFQLLIAIHRMTGSLQVNES